VTSPRGDAAVMLVLGVYGTAAVELILS